MDAAWQQIVALSYAFIPSRLNVCNDSDSFYNQQFHACHAPGSDEIAGIVQRRTLARGLCPALIQNMKFDDEQSETHSVRFTLTLQYSF